MISSNDSPISLHSCVRGQSSQESWLEITQTTSATLGSALPPSLYRGGPPPLAADTSVVERSHLHLHEGDGELVAFPVVPVDTLPERKCHFRAEWFQGDVPENHGKCSTSGVSQNKRHFSQSAHRVVTRTSWLRSYTRNLRWQSLPANLHQQRSSAAFSLTAAGSLCDSAAPPPSAYLWWLQAAEMKGSRQSREKQK